MNQTPEPQGGPVEQSVEKRDEALTTADLANAQTPAETRAAEDRTFADRGEAEAGASAPEEAATPLFAPQQANELRERWDSIQTGFVDAPRKAVEQADSLVAEAMKRLAETFATERDRLEGQWDRGDDVSTEDLRLVLRRYRSFFGRLLSI